MSKKYCSATITGLPHRYPTVGRNSPAKLLDIHEQTSTHVQRKRGNLRLELRNEDTLFLLLKLICQIPLALLTSPPSRTSE